MHPFHTASDLLFKHTLDSFKYNLFIPFSLAAYKVQHAHILTLNWPYLRFTTISIQPVH